MQNTDKKDFVEVLNGLATIKGKTLTVASLDLWWACMADWPIEDFKAGAARLLKTCEFMPTPKDFEDLRKAGQQTAAEAWIEMRRYLKWGLHAYTVDPACPARIAKCIYAVGGPHTIAMCETDKLHFLERRFAEHYENMGQIDEARAALPSAFMARVGKIGV